MYQNIVCSRVHLSLTSYRLVSVDLSEEDFYIYMNTIRLGANIPDPGQPPYFLGHLRTFIEPPVITGPPFIDSKLSLSTE